MTRYNLTTAPTVLPVSRAELLNYLKINDDADLPVAEETMIDGIIEGATSVIEQHLGRKLITQTWTASLDHWRGVWKCPHGYLQSVTSVKVVADDGTLTTQAATTYGVAAGNDGMLWQRPGYSWSTSTRPLDWLRIEYVAGYGDAAADVPEAIRAAIMQVAAIMYEHRQSPAWDFGTQIPTVIADRIECYKVFRTY